MPCDTQWNRGQTQQQRLAEVAAAAQKAEDAIKAGRAKFKVGPQGAVAIDGLSDSERAGMTDLCIVRRLMAKGSASTRMALARAEQLAGRGVSKQMVQQGVHSHDGGRSWHDGH